MRLISSTVLMNHTSPSMCRTNEQTGLQGRVHDHTANLVHEQWVSGDSFNYKKADQSSLRLPDSTMINSSCTGHVSDARGGGDQPVGDSIAHTSGLNNHIRPHSTDENPLGNSRAASTGSTRSDTPGVEGTATTPGGAPRARRADPNILRRGASIRGEVLPEGWRLNDGIRERVLPLKSSGRYFDTYDESVRSNKGPNWTPPSGDVVPQTDEEMLPFVDLLMKAILDLTQYTDNPSLAMKKRFFDIGWEEGQPMGAEITNPYYPKHVFERLAWQTVVSISKPSSCTCF
jgi:hypothetical protein